jgi:hypothetical protein
MDHPLEVAQRLENAAKVSAFSKAWCRPKNGSSPA